MRYASINHLIETATPAIGLPALAAVTEAHNRMGRRRNDERESMQDAENPRREATGDRR